MLKANFKRVFFITLITTLILVAGCSSPEDKKEAQIEEALALSAGGDHAEALAQLEELSAQYPSDIEIFSAMGQIYAADDDLSMAAFFLEQAHNQSPDDTELLLQAYQGLEAANEPAGRLLEKLSNQAPEAMTPDLWIRLGQIRQAENKIQAALDAYMKGVDPEAQKPDPETAAAIGQLFVKVGNLPQAEVWLEMAADNDDPNALTALIGLLEIKLRQKDWAGAETTIAQLDKQFPGAIEASEWQDERQELARWRKAQDALEAQLARDEEEKKAAEARAAAEAAQAETEIAEATTNPETGADSENATTEGKAQIIADLEAAEAMADAPAIEFTTDEDEEDTAPTEESGSKAITYDPSIAIEPADPAFTFEVNFDQAPIAEETTYAVESLPPVGPSPTPAVTEMEPLPVLDGRGQLDSISPDSRPRTIEELLAEAEAATLDRDFKAAIRKYWAAISISNNRPEVWNLLSRAYLVDGQLNNAETTALEAVRLEPREVAYTLDYLRVAQRSKQPNNFLSELETAYDRFPSSPEITLSLARAHERISEDRPTARNLYLRFIDIAPNHPLVPEARAAVLRTARSAE